MQPQRAMVAANIANLPASTGNQHGEVAANLQSPPTRKQAVEMLNVSERSVNADRVPGGKRSAEFQRKYAKAIKAIEGGTIAPEVKPVVVHVSCGTRTASSILAKAVKDDERFARDSRGRVTFKAVA